MIGVNPITTIQNNTDAEVKRIMRRGVKRLRPRTMMETVDWQCDRRGGSAGTDVKSQDGAPR